MSTPCWDFNTCSAPFELNKWLSTVAYIEEHFEHSTLDAASWSPICNNVFAELSMYLFSCPDIHSQIEGTLQYHNNKLMSTLTDRYIYLFPNLAWNKLPRNSTLCLMCTRHKDDGIPSLARFYPWHNRTYCNCYCFVVKYFRGCTVAISWKDISSCAIWNFYMCWRFFIPGSAQRILTDTLHLIGISSTSISLQEAPSTRYLPQKCFSLKYLLSL